MKEHQAPWKVQRPVPDIVIKSPRYTLDHVVAGRLVGGRRKKNARTRGESVLRKLCTSLVLDFCSSRVFRVKAGEGRGEINSTIANAVRKTKGCHKGDKKRDSLRNVLRPGGEHARSSTKLDKSVRNTRLVSHAETRRGYKREGRVSKGTSKVLFLFSFLFFFFSFVFRRRNLFVEDLTDTQKKNL